MATQQQIQAIAGIMANLGHVLVPEREIWIDGDTCFDADRIARLNATGWTFVVSGSLGGTIRHEGVILTDAELDQAWQGAATLQAALA